MRIYLYYYDGKFDWADVGTKDDIPVEITYTEFCKLKSLGIANSDIETEEAL